MFTEPSEIPTPPPDKVNALFKNNKKQTVDRKSPNHSDSLDYNFKKIIDKY